MSLVGAGGMGEVYRAHDPRVGRDVAIKVVPRSVAQDPERLRRFEREARAAGALNHPNLLTLFELGMHDGAPFLVTELLEGTTLAGLLRPPALVNPHQATKSPLPLRKILDYAAQIANGLAAAHDKSIVHRDLKPANIFVTTEERVKLLDFGLAKTVSFADDSAADGSRTTTPGAVVGTVGYMAPEQVRGHLVDHRADIFSFGAVLYEMITGVEPFRRETAVETLNAILHDDPPPIPVGAAPHSLVRIVEHALAKNPAMRFQSMHDVAFTLETLGGSDDRHAVRAPRLDEATQNSVVAFTRMTFRRGFIMTARFAPDGSVVYGAAWEDQPLEIFASHPGNPESRPLGLPEGDVLAVSSKGDLAISVGRHYVINYVTRGVLARVPLTGGAPRELCEDVQDADWTPDGRDLMILRTAGDRCRVELPIGNVIYETTDWLGKPRISPNGEWIAFSEHPVVGDDGGCVVVIDRKGKVKLRSVGGASVSGVAWTPNSSEVWASTSLRGSTRDIIGYSLDGRERIVLAAPGRYTLHDVAADGRVLLTFDNCRREIMGGSPGTERERNLSWFDWSVPTGLTPDGKRIVIEEQGSPHGPGMDNAIYVRATDGGPAIHLCQGRARAITPDGKFVVVLSGSPPSLSIVPTGIGETRPLAITGLQTFAGGEFSHDGNHLAVLGREAGQPQRLYAIDLAAGGGAARLLSEDSVTWPFAMAPDGSAVAALNLDRTPMIYPTNGGDAQPLKGGSPGERPIGWSEDGRSIFLCGKGRVAADIVRVDVATGERTPWHTIHPADPAGIMEIYPVRITPDGKHYVYSYRRFLSDLFIVRGAT